MKAVGIDIGSVSTETIIIDENKNIIGFDISRTGSSSKAAAQRSLENAMKNANVNISGIDLIVATGYGRKVVPFESKEVSEISCHAMGAHYLFHDTRTIIDIGGQDSKAIKVNEKGEMIDFIMNDKCAAGTGRFLEVMAGVLDADVKQLGEISLTATKNIPISSMCTVFAESEVISLIASDNKREDIIKGLHSAVADRVISLSRKIKIASAVTLTGGVNNNMGVVEAIKNKLPDVRINVPKQPDIVGALGAALFAHSICLKSEIKSNLSAEGLNVR